MNEDSLMERPPPHSSSSRSGAISSGMDLSSLDFQLLNKQGWREGAGLGASEQASVGRVSNSLARSTEAIDSSNRGFQLLKKHGWKEGTGLGVFEQGRLEPVETYLKNNKRGLGADRVKKKVHPSHTGRSDQNNENEKKPPKKSKTLSKKMRKLQEQEQRLQEKEFERAFFREFWPENV
ncbi:G patch domain-containing protein 11 isoform X2 [Rhodamnia argentea]|uniref:G patch domain-containing protein 11 isoform X2 n=1 Tax=Rhodamnia argentea TaxID=178133 RepID=A0A8B8QXR1_9MYRT|nr:G patch domain-containing protein 11 isoform X2 [Rhodamnia argentea]